LISSGGPFFPPKNAFTFRMIAENSGAESIAKARKTTDSIIVSHG